VLTPECQKRCNFRSDTADLFAEHITCHLQHCLGGGSIRKRSFRTDIRSFSSCSLVSFHVLMFQQVFFPLLLGFTLWQ